MTLADLLRREVSMLKLKRLISLVVYLFFLLPSIAWAALPKCEDVFATGLGSFNNTTVSMGVRARVYGQGSNLVTTRSLSTHPSTRCNDERCAATNTEPSQINAPDTSGWKTSIGSNEKLSGDYFINGSLALTNNNFPLSGPTRIYVTGAISISGSSASDAENLIVYAEGNVALYSDINLYMYTNSNIYIAEKVIIEGALVAGAGITFSKQAELTYIAPTSAQLDIICDSGSEPIVYTPIAEYRFDELSWLSGGANQVLESIQGAHGTAYGVQPTEGKICNAANFDTSNTQDYIALESTLLNSSTFTVSAWVKSNFTGSQVLLSGAQTSSQDNEVIWWQTSSTSFEPWINQYPGYRINHTNIASNTWQHLVWRRDGSESCLFVNGQSAGCIYNNLSDSLAVSSLILGQEQDALAGGFDLNQRWKGLIDELLIFDQAISETQIQTIYTNQNQGLSWDGLAREAYCDANGWWQLDGDFIDQNVTNAHNLIPYNTPSFSSVSPGPAKVINDQSTCEYIEFDGTNYASVDDTGQYNFPELTVSAWIYPTEAPSSDLHAIVSKDEHFELHLNSTRKLYWWWQNSNREMRFFTSSASIPLNTWTHVAVVYKSGVQQMYINGVADASRNYTGGLADSPCEFYIGTDVATNTLSNCGGVLEYRNFKGKMDEVRIYSRALEQSEIEADINTVRTCPNPPSVDHYRITLNDNSGLTCESESFKLEACSDEICSDYYSDTTTVGLNVSNSDNLTWLPNNPFSFDGVQTVTINKTSPGRVNFSLNQTSTDPLSDLRCFVNGTEVALTECYIDFSDTGFKISQIDHQIAANSFQATLRAVKKDDETGACTSIFTDEKTVEMTFNDIAPENSAGMDFIINNTPVTSNTAVPVNFDAANGYLATLDINYFDAGKISFTVSANAPNNAVLTDTSNEFVVRPARFDVLVDNLPAVSNATGEKFKMAGQVFPVTIKALNADDGITQSFDSDQVDANSFRLTHELQSPSITATNNVRNGTLKMNDTIDFENGTTSINIDFNEVGVIRLNAELDSINYMNHGDTQTILGQRDNVGRFYPAQFELINSEITNGCGSFTYFSQPFESLQYQVEAQTSQGARTWNYIESVNNTENYAKALIENSIKNESPNADYLAASELAARYEVPLASWQNGHYQLVTTTAVLKRDTLALQNGELPSSHLTHLVPMIKLTDPDLSPLINLDIHDEVFTSPAITANSKALSIDAGNIITPLDMRFGRLVLNDNFGNEFEALQIPLKVEFWDGQNFITNQNDSCTEYFEARLVVEDNHTTSQQGANNQFVNGIYPQGQGLYLDAANQSRSYQVDYVSPDEWLKYDWNNNNDYSDNPSGKMQFGRFRGNDRVIYWREN